MISSLFHTAFYNPIYNVLVALVAFVPGSDVGIAVILITILIHIILLPFTLSAARAGRAMKALEPRIKDLKEKHKGDKEAEALATWALYREARVNPFASVVTLLIQLPVLLALYWVFRYEPFTSIDTMRIYAFTPIPTHVSMEFLGLLSVAGKSLLLAILAGLTQFIQAHVALSNAATAEGAQADFQKVMGAQLKYVFPILIGVLSYTTSGAVALYFLTSNIVGALREWYVRKKFSHNPGP